MHRRIMGTEMEYPIFKIESDQTGRATQYKLSAYELEGLMEDWPSDTVRVQDFLGNGGRLYIEGGDFLEYATAEASNPLDVLATEIAGERLIMDLLDHARQYRAYGRIDAYKRVVPFGPGQKTSWGYHENYQALRKYVRPQDRAGLSPLALHIATRPIFTGAGHIVVPTNPQRNALFYLSQKTKTLRVDFSGRTSHSKPLINLRDEPYAREKYTRIHVTSGDPHMSPWATRMQLGTTSLVLMLSEYGAARKLDHLLPAPGKIFRIAHKVAADVSLRRTVELANGSTIRPLDMQWEIYGQVDKIRSELDADSQLTWTLTEWKSVLEQAERGVEALPVGVEWALKYRLLRDQPDDNLRAARLDEQWDKLAPSGIGMLLRQSAWQEWMPAEEQITTCPQDTRAVLRAEVVRMLEDRYEERPSIQICWDKVILSYGPKAKQDIIFNLKPFDIEKPGMLEAIRKVVCEGGQSQSDLLQ